MTALRPAVGVAAGLSLGHAGRRHGHGARAPRRHRRPVGRHARRPGRPADPRGARGASGAPGYPDHRGHAALRASAVGCAAPPLRHHRTCRRRGAAGHRHQGTHRVAADAAWGSAPTTRSVVPELAYPTYDVGARLAGAQVLRGGLADPARPAHAGAGVPQLAEQSDGRGARRRPPAQGRRLGARTRGAGRVRRVLSGAGLGRRTRLGAAPVGVRRRPHRSAGRALAVEDVVAGRLPRRFRGRRSRGGRRAAGGAQARRDDGADAGAGRDGGRPRRRRARTRAARALCPPARRAAAGGPRRGVHRRPLRGRAVSVGHPRRAVPRHRRRGWPSAGSWWRPASSTGRAAPSTCGSR